MRLFGNAICYDRHVIKSHNMGARTHSMRTWKVCLCSCALALSQIFAAARTAAISLLGHLPSHIFSHTLRDLFWKGLHSLKSSFLLSSKCYLPKTRQWKLVFNISPHFRRFRPFFVAGRAHFTCAGQEIKDFERIPTVLDILIVTMEFSARVCSRKNS